jgi:hypothetical protein
MKALEQISRQSRTVKLWVDVLLKPVLLMMIYIRAEREGDWILHLDTFRKMLPYYIAARHGNYARYGLYYLRPMEKLPLHVESLFLKGQHVTRHIRGRMACTVTSLDESLEDMDYKLPHLLQAGIRHEGD